MKRSFFTAAFTAAVIALILVWPGPCPAGGGSATERVSVAGAGEKFERGRALKIIRGGALNGTKFGVDESVFEYDEGWVLLESFVDQESGLIVVRTRPADESEWKDGGAGTRIIPTKQYIVDRAGEKILAAFEWKRFFSYAPAETMSGDGRFRLVTTRVHDPKNCTDVINEVLFDAATGAKLAESTGAAFLGRKRETLLESRERNAAAEKARNAGSPAAGGPRTSAAAGDGAAGTASTGMQENASPKQLCPNCKKAVARDQRYPKYLCGDCCGLVTDEKGRKVVFYNESLIGTGCRGYYAGAGGKKEYPSFACYIDGVEYYASEARFGGIVIQKRDE